MLMGTLLEDGQVRTSGLALLSESRSMRPLCLVRHSLSSLHLLGAADGQQRRSHHSADACACGLGACGGAYGLRTPQGGCTGEGEINHMYIQAVVCTFACTYAYHLPVPGSCCRLLGKAAQTC